MKTGRSLRSKQQRDRARRPTEFLRQLSPILTFASSNKWKVESMIRAGAQLDLRFRVE